MAQETVRTLRIEVKSNELGTAKKEVDLLNKELKDLKKTTKDGVLATNEQSKRMAELSVNLKAAKNRYHDLESEVLKTNDAFKKNSGFVNGIKKGISEVAVKFMAAVAAVTAFAQSLSSVIATRSDFEKFEAVLANTLGDKNKALSVLKDIQEFASKTPFAVRELTEAYVKLVNQGFKPTIEQMESLGDLAASTGKSFDQLAEAIIDAQTGEFERLKEFGIRAKKEGENVTFTFKGVKKQVEFTAESIQNYILGLGAAVGVSGSMAAISETLGGKVSNLGDAWDSMLNNLGKSQVWKSTISYITTLVSSMNQLIEAETFEQKSAKERLRLFRERLKTEQDRIKAINAEIELQKAQRDSKAKEIEDLRLSIAENKRLGGAWDDNNDKLISQANALQKQVTIHNLYINSLGGIRKEENEQIKAKQENTKEINKNTQAVKENATAKEDLAKKEYEFYVEMLKLRKAINDENTKGFTQIDQPKLKALDTEMQTARDLFAEQQENNNKKIEKEQLYQDSLLATADLMNNIASLAKEDSVEQKILSSGAAIINTYVGATKALATLPPPLSFITAASTIASGLASVAKINAVQFADGGLVPKGQNIPTQRNGDNILATVKTGEVVLNRDQQMKIGGANTFRKIGVPGFATGGIAGARIPDNIGTSKGLSTQTVRVIQVQRDFEKSQKEFKVAQTQGNF